MGKNKSHLNKSKKFTITNHKLQNLLMKLSNIATEIHIETVMEISSRKSMYGINMLGVEIGYVRFNGERPSSKQMKYFFLNIYKKNKNFP